MIDLHSHILPMVDDGAKDLAMALDMGRFAVQQGLKTVAATPHFYEIPDWGKIKAKVKALQEEFLEAKIELELVCGAELMLDLDLLEMDAKDIPTYGDLGKFALVEFPLNQTPIYAEQVFFDLQTKGITPIIAHPERYSAVADDPNLALLWLRQGCLIQMNTGSILGRFGSKIKQTAEIMLTHQMVHIVASDAHGIERRRLNLPEARHELVGLLGEARTNELIKNNPKAILAGEFQPREQPLEYRKKRRFFFF